MQVTRWQIDFRRWEICPKRVQKACTFRDFGTLFWHSYGWIIVNYNPWNEIVSKARGMAIRGYQEEIIILEFFLITKATYLHT